MADNQQSGSQSGNQHNRPQLSWGQPSGQGNRDRAQGGSSASKQPSASPQASPSSSQLIGMFVAGLIIGLLVAWAWFDLRGSTSEGTSATSTSTDQFAITQTSAPTSSGSSSAKMATSGSNTASSGGNATGTQVAGASITTPASEPAGYSVTVTSVSASEPVWAVVYADAGRTQILGAARFAARKSGTIDLIHPTVAGKTYWVGLVTDTASHEWGTHTDHQAILGSDGNPVVSQFTAQ